MVLAWVLAQGPNVIVIPGARTVAHTLDGVAAGRLALGDEDLRRITEAEFDRR